MTSTADRRSFFAKLLGLAAAPVLVKCEMPSEPPFRVVQTKTRVLMFHVQATGDANALIVNDSTGYVGLGKCRQ